ncbi:conserved hypothetical protein [Magnetospirillum molischianum DSM 120]|uniref:Uncharacterized protein n=2 Tax=Magnetospirillum molischianum TaxID=1083 RepID=H8FPA7_MAGML|nr:conserved hypothetical protein [Magnetospirillum molischianum DSM 120]
MYTQGIGRTQAQISLSPKKSVRLSHSGIGQGKTMGEIVNLNRVRKSKARAEKETKAEANRVKFGLSKAEKQAVRRERERQTEDLDGKKLDTPT